MGKYSSSWQYASRLSKQKQIIGHSCVGSLAPTELGFKRKRAECYVCVRGISICLMCVCVGGGGGPVSLMCLPLSVRRGLSTVGRVPVCAGSMSALRKLCKMG